MVSEKKLQAIEQELADLIPPRVKDDYREKLKKRINKISRRLKDEHISNIDVEVERLKEELETEADPLQRKISEFIINNIGAS